MRETHTEGPFFSRREILEGAGAFIFTAATSSLVRGEPNRVIENQFESWRWESPEVDVRYSDGWAAALDMLGVSRTGDIRPYHRANTLWRAKRACRGERFDQIESDLTDLPDGRVIVAHQETDYWDMDLDKYHQCVGSRVFEVGRFKLLKYDFKTEGAFINGFSQIEEFNQGRPHIINANKLGEFKRTLTVDEIAQLNRHPGVIWSSGNSRLAEDWEKYGPVLVDHIKNAHEAVNGNMTYVVQAGQFATMYERDPDWYRPASEAGVVTTIYKGDSWSLSDRERIAIKETLKPWQVVLDCK